MRRRQLAKPMKSYVETNVERLMKSIVIYVVLLWITIDGYKLVRYESSPNPDTHVKCPDCKELVVKNATACPHCQCKLIASE